MAVEFNKPGFILLILGKIKVGVPSFKLYSKIYTSRDPNSDTFKRYRTNTMS